MTRRKCLSLKRKSGYPQAPNLFKTFEDVLNLPGPGGKEVQRGPMQAIFCGFAA